MKNAISVFIVPERNIFQALNTAPHIVHYEWGQSLLLLVDIISSISILSFMAKLWEEE